MRSFRLVVVCEIDCFTCAAKFIKTLQGGKQGLFDMSGGEYVNLRIIYSAGFSNALFSSRLSRISALFFSLSG